MNWRRFIRPSITAETARQKVRMFLLWDVGNLLRDGTPELMPGVPLRWSVPVVLTSPTCGVVGQVGTILVDAHTAELCVDASVLADISANVTRLTKIRGLDKPLRAKPDQDPARDAIRE